MKKEVRTVVYDDELRIEAYRFEGIVHYRGINIANSDVSTSKARASS